MTKLSKILKLGHPKLYEVSEPLVKRDLESLQNIVDELSDILTEFKTQYHVGRAIAAPQIGVMKRLIYMNLTEPMVIINPELYDFSQEMIELWDDCMSFPNLLIRVRRHRKCRMKFLNQDWEDEIWELEDDPSELLQHEVDHLNGVLAVQRAVDNKSFTWR